eukprot:1597777-Rhodomonas_salina.1
MREERQTSTWILSHLWMEPLVPASCNLRFGMRVGRARIGRREVDAVGRGVRRRHGRCLGPCWRSLLLDCRPDARAGCQCFATASRASSRGVLSELHREACAA